MADIFSEWKKALEDLNGCVEQSIEKIHQCKAAVQDIIPEYVDDRREGKYIRDNSRIVLSAPEIIIGNVDSDGNLWAGSGSLVTIRSNALSMEATTGTSGFGGGSIISRAPIIRSIAVDPGIDGKENVVCGVSEIVGQAKAIALVSNSDNASFLPPECTGQGLMLKSDTTININSSVGCESKKARIDSLVNDLKSKKTEQKNRASTLKKIFEDGLKRVSEAMKYFDEHSDDIDTVRTDEQMLEDKRIEFNQGVSYLTKALSDYTAQLSELAETCRTIKALEDTKKSIPAAGDFKTKTTKANIMVKTEKLDVISSDDDGKLRTNPEAGVNVRAQSISVQSRDREDVLFPEGSISLGAKKIDISTEDIKYKDKEKRDSGDRTSVGDIHIASKTLKIEAVDSEFDSKGPKEKAFTKDGKFDLRMENISISSTDTEGKAAGKISINAKQTEVKSFNVKKEDRKDDKIAEGGVLVLTAEKVFAGSRDKTNKTKQLQVVAEKTAVMGDTTAELQQGEGKAVVQLDGGNASIGGSKTQIYGETTVNAKSTFKGDITAPKASIDNIEAKKSFKSTNISDGIAVPAAPSSAKLSAKLKQEENKPS